LNKSAINKESSHWKWCNWKACSFNFFLHYL